MDWTCQPTYWIPLKRMIDSKVFDISGLSVNPMSVMATNLGFTFSPRLSSSFFICPWRKWLVAFKVIITRKGAISLIRTGEYLNFETLNYGIRNTDIRWRRLEFALDAHWPRLSRCFKTHFFIFRRPLLRAQVPVFRGSVYLKEFLKTCVFKLCYKYGKEKLNFKNLCRELPHKSTFILCVIKKMQKLL